MVFEAIEGSAYSSPLLFRVETVLWKRAAKKVGNWHRGVVDATNRFMTRWHRGEAEESWQRLTAEDAKSSNQGNPGGPRGRRNSRSCGKVPVWLISRACATIALNPLQRVVISALFVSVEFNEGSAKATVMTCHRSFVFLLPYMPPHWPMPAYSSSSSYCFCP